MEENRVPQTGSGRDKTSLLPLERRVLRTIRKYAMIESGDHILVGVSGGADSTALLACLHRLAARLGITLSVAHLNHRMRGAESDADEEFVRLLSHRFSLPFLSEGIAVKELSAAAGMNIEESARDTRYAFLRRTARRAGASRIAVGHTMNDQAETILMRLLRGSGIEGLAAIRPVLGGTIIRPLLECSRQEVLEYLSRRGIGHREDISNLDLRYRRNLLRHEWLPYLEKKLNPRVIQTLAREAEMAHETATFLNHLALKEYETLRMNRGEAVVLPSESVKRLQAAISKLVLRIAIREVRGSLRGISAFHVDEILRLCSPGKSGKWVGLPGGFVVAREFRDLVFMKGQQEKAPAFCYPLRVPGRCAVPEAGIEVSASISDIAGTPDLSRRVFLDGKSLPVSLVVRSRLPGDRYGGPMHRRVKKMLIDAKMSRHLRTGHPMVASGCNVVWVPGFHPAKPFRVRAESGECVVLEIRSLTHRS